MTALRMWKVVGLLCVALPLLPADLEQGKGLYGEKKYQEAIEELQPLVEEAPGNREARYYLALSLIAVERVDEAEAQLAEIEKANERDPSASDMKVARARILSSRQQYDAASASLKEVITSDPNNIQARMARAETDLHRKDYESVAADAEQVIALDPENAYAYYYAGIAFSNLSRPDKMADHFQRFLQLAPDAPEAPKVQSLMRSLRR